LYLLQLNIFVFSFDLENISIAGSLGFLIVFSLVNLANFKLYKETNANRFIAGFGFFLTSLSAVILVGYNFIHNIKALGSSLVLILIVILASYFYKKIAKMNLSKYLDKDLEDKLN
jgi:hypothetical protein